MDRVARWGHFPDAEIVFEALQGSKFEVKKGWDGNEMLQLIYIIINDCLTQGTIGSMYIIK